MSRQSELEKARHASERGDILRTLKEDYSREMTNLGSLLRALDAQGVALGLESLCFHLQYLADSGYVQIWRTRDLPGFRTDRAHVAGHPDAIRFAKLLPRGLQLLDGLVPEDVSIAF